MPPRQAAADKAPERQHDAERTRNEILEVAISEFAAQGFAGARVDEIAARTRTTKRMIYYYFGSKEQLYIAVLERAYGEIRSLERELDVDHLEPTDAIRRLAEITFDHHEAHPEFIRLVSIENIHNAEHMAKSERLTNLSTSVIDLIERILERGRADGSFVRDIDPETYDVRADGELLVCEPADKLPMAQRYFLF